MSSKLNRQFQTGSSCTGAGNGEYGSYSWDTIHNLVATGVAGTKEIFWVIFRILSILVSIDWLPSYYSCPSRRSTSKPVQRLVWSFFLVCRERFWGDQLQKQLGCKHHESSAKRYDDKSMIQGKGSFIDIVNSEHYSVISFFTCRSLHGAPTQRESYRARCKNCPRYEGLLPKWFYQP